MRRSTPLVALILIVLAAGCGGLVGDDGAEPDDRELAPGLSESEVTDVHLLLTEHHDHLENEHYQTELERTATDEAGSVVGHETFSQVVAAGGAPARERVVLQGEADVTAYDQWIDSETPLVRQNESGSTTYDVGARQRVDPAPPIPLDDAYDSVETITVEEEPDERYYLEGTAERLDNYESVSFTLVLSEEGYLTTYALEGELPDDDESVFATDRSTVEEEFTLEPVDDGPEEPDWLEEAREAVAAEHDT